MSPYSPELVVNLGTQRFAAAAVSSLDGGGQPNERRARLLYPHLKRLELSRRHWLFAKKRYVPARLPELADEDDGYVYQYEIPSEVCSPLQSDDYPFRVMGGNLLSPMSTGFKFYAIIDQAEIRFTADFAEVLALSCACAMVEQNTQRDTLFQRLNQWYGNAITAAYRNNAIQREHERTDKREDKFSWLNSAYNPGMGY